MLVKHSPKKLVIAEAVTLKDLVHRIFCGKQISVDKGKAVLILIFQEGHTHSLFKKTAEITRLEKGNLGNLLQGNLPFVIGSNIIQDIVHSVQILFFLTEIRLKNLYAEAVIKLIQKFKKKAVEPQKKACWPDVIDNLHLFQNGFQNRKLRLDNGILCMDIPEKEELLDIWNIFLKKVQRNLQKDRCIGLSTFGGMGNIGIDENAVSGRQDRGVRFYRYIKATFLKIDNFHSPVPVDRDIASLIHRGIKFHICSFCYIYNLIRNRCGSFGTLFIHKKSLRKKHN